MTYQLEISTDLLTWLTHSEQTASKLRANCEQTASNPAGILQFMLTQPLGIPKMFYRVRLP